MRVTAASPSAKMITKNQIWQFQSSKQHTDVSYRYSEKYDFLLMISVLQQKNKNNVNVRFTLILSR